MQKVLKYLFVVTLSAFPVCAKAQLPGEIQFPSLKDQYAQAQAEQAQLICDKRMNEMQTLPEAAGYQFIGSMCGVEYNVDRRTEPKAPRTPGNPPARSGLAALIGGISENANASIHIDVSFKYDGNGNITEENWSIDIRGSTTAQIGMDDIVGKQHK